MQYFEYIPNIGSLYLIKTFVRYDGRDLLFLCQSIETATTYLCLQIRECFRRVKWLAVPINATKLQAFISNKTSVREIFQSAVADVVQICWDGNIQTVSCNVEIETIPAIGGLPLDELIKTKERKL